jgi:hypothetical protein
MVTLPPDPYAPDPIHNPDGTVTKPVGQTDTLPGPENSEPPELVSDDANDVPVNRPTSKAGH